MAPSSPSSPSSPSVQKSRSEQMGTEPVGKLLWKFSLPGVIAMVVHATYYVVDSIFVGGLGPDAIAAVTVVFPVMMLLLAIGSGVGVGSSSLVARRLGEKKREDANIALGQALGISLVLGILISIAGYLFGYPLLKLVGATNEIIGNSFSYFSIIILGAVFGLVNMVSANLVRAEGNPILPMITMIASTALNIGLDPVFIYALKMGVAGAALATVISQVIPSVVLLSYLFGHKTEYKVKLANFLPNFKILGEIFKIGAPQMLMMLLGSVTMAFTIKVVSALGTIVIATFGIYGNIMQFGMMPCVGISGGAMPIIGYNYGARNNQRVRATLVRTIIVCTAITAMVSLLAIIFPQGLASIFNRSRDFLTYAGQALRIAFLGFALEGSLIAFTTYFQGTGQAVPSLVTGVVSRILIPPTVLLLMSFKNPVSIWFAIPFIDVVLFIMYSVWVYASMKKLGIWFSGKPREVPSIAGREPVLESVEIEDVSNVQKEE
jgi:putative MATE family efflux protein